AYELPAALGAIISPPEYAATSEPFVTMMVSVARVLRGAMSTVTATAERPLMLIPLGFTDRTVTLGPRTFTSAAVMLLSMPLPVSSSVSVCPACTVLPAPVQPQAVRFAFPIATRGSSRVGAPAAAERAAWLTDPGETVSCAGAALPP